MAQPGKAVSDRLQHVRRAIAVLEFGSVDHREEHQAERIGDDVALASLDLLARCPAGDRIAIGRRRPRNAQPLGGFHRLKSITPAVGVPRAPPLRVLMTSRWLIVCHRPASRQA